MRFFSCRGCLAAVCLAAIVGLNVAAPAQAAISIVNSNGASPGDDFTNASTSNTTPSTPGAALGASNWYYNNVRNNGHVGVNTDVPRNGNGSVSFSSTQGPGGNSSKADVEYYLPGGASLGTLGDLSALSYDWYRASGGNASQWLHPVLRLFVTSPDHTQSGYLVFEREVNLNNMAAVPTDSWQTDDIAASDSRLWSTGSTLPYNLNGTNGTAKYYDALTLSQWQSSYANYEVLGISAGVGSGWGTFAGAVDNITIAFGNADPTTFNFEVAGAEVPEPASLLAWGLLALGGLGYVRLRRNKRG